MWSYTLFFVSVTLSMCDLVYDWQKAIYFSVSIAVFLLRGCYFCLISHRIFPSVGVFFLILCLPISLSLSAFVLDQLLWIMALSKHIVARRSRHDIWKISNKANQIRWKVDHDQVEHCILAVFSCYFIEVYMSVLWYNWCACVCHTKSTTIYNKSTYFESILQFVDHLNL